MHTRARAAFPKLLTQAEYAGARPGQRQDRSLRGMLAGFTGSEHAAISATPLILAAAAVAAGLAVAILAAALV